MAPIEIRAVGDGSADVVRRRTAVVLGMNESSKLSAPGTERS
jgi:hypothetical protein